MGFWKETRWRAKCEICGLHDASGLSLQTKAHAKDFVHHIHNWIIKGDKVFCSQKCTDEFGGFE